MRPVRRVELVPRGMLREKPTPFRRRPQTLGAVGLVWNYENRRGQSPARIRALDRRKQRSQRVDLYHPGCAPIQGWKTLR